MNLDKITTKGIYTYDSKKASQSLSTPMKFEIKNLDIKTGAALCEILEDGFYKKLFRSKYGEPWKTVYIIDKREEKQ